MSRDEHIGRYRHAAEFRREGLVSTRCGESTGRGGTCDLVQGHSGHHRAMPKRMRLARAARAASQ